MSEPPGMEPAGRMGRGRRHLGLPQRAQLRKPISNIHGARGETRTRTTQGRGILSPLRLPFRHSGNGCTYRRSAIPGQSGAKFESGSWAAIIAPRGLRAAASTGNERAHPNGGIIGATPRSSRFRNAYSSSRRAVFRKSECLELHTTGRYRLRAIETRCGFWLWSASSKAPSVPFRPT